MDFDIGFVFEERISGLIEGAPGRIMRPESERKGWEPTDSEPEKVLAACRPIRKENETAE